MAHDKGKPSGINKNEGSTGVPANISPEKIKTSEEITDKHTRDDEKVAENIREMHPNRNEDKNDATNAGGYRN